MPTTTRGKKTKIDYSDAIPYGRIYCLNDKYLKPVPEDSLINVAKNAVKTEKIEEENE